MREQMGRELSAALGVTCVIDGRHLQGLSSLDLVPRACDQGIMGDWLDPQQDNEQGSNGVQMKQQPEEKKQETWTNSTLMIPNLIQ